MTFETRAVAALAESEPLVPITIERRDVLADDVRIEIEYSGICHSDIHTVRGEWGQRPYPIVPGHEIIGKVVEVGSAVTKHKVGDRVGVGVIVDSCRTCEKCLQGLENYCDKALFTFGHADPHLPGKITQGGYSQTIVVTEDFTYSIPEGLDPAGAAPLMCAGITVYSPLRHWNVGPGMTVAVAGIGGLGHLAVKFAHAMGAHVIAMTRSNNKADLAQKLGADEVLVTSNPEQMAARAGTIDLIISTLPGNHDMSPYLELLNLDGTYVIVGALDEMTHNLNLRLLLGRRRSIAGSMIGGVPETQEMLDFCGEHNIVSEIELIYADYINQAYDRVVAGDVTGRFVIDAQTI